MTATVHLRHDSQATSSQSKNAIRNTTKGKAKNVKPTDRARKFSLMLIPPPIQASCRDSTTFFRGLLPDVRGFEWWDWLGRLIR